MIVCSRVSVICRGADASWTVDPQGNWICPGHAHEAWAEEKERMARAMGIAVPAADGAARLPEEFTSVRWGVVFQLPGVVKPVMGGMGKSFWWPYISHRRKLGLKKKYPISEGKLISWGKKGAPQKNEDGKNA